MFQLNSTAKFLKPANFYNFKILVQNTHFFCFKKAWTLNFLRTVTISIDSTAGLLPLPSLKTSVFLEKRKYFLILPNPKIWKFWETLLVSSHCTANLLPSAIFENFKAFFWKPIFFCKKNPAFERFEKSHCSVRIWHQIG